jgi:hypothetical protein
MKLTFSLFLQIHSAEAAADKLLYAGFNESQMNAVTQELVVKEYLFIRRHEASVLRIDNPERSGISVLKELFSGKKSLHSNDAGEILFGGQIATEMSELLGRRPDSSLMTILTDFGIPESVASRYIEGLIADGILFWIKAEDNKEELIIQLYKENKGISHLSIPF